MNQTELITLSKEYIEGLLHVPVTTLPDTTEALTHFFQQHLPSFYTESLREASIQKLIQSYPAGIITDLKNSLHINYLLCPYGNDELLIIGPYITQPPTPKYCEKLLVENHINRGYAIAFNLFYQSFTVCLSSTLHYAASVLIKRLLNLAENPDIHSICLSPLHHKDFSFIDDIENDELTKQIIEQRYAAEKLFLVDVYNGNTESAVAHYAEFEKITACIQRADSPLRSKKNLFYTLNTQLRTTAQKAGVHPLYLDNISGNFARLAEQSNTLDELTNLKHYMLPAYCRLVRQQTLNNYSPSVRNVIIYIKHNLAEPMTLNSLAAECNLSPSYLSKLFNAEVGESIPNYINHLRANRAARLLQTTDLSIKAICLQIGVLDTNYFTKIFKKYYDLSPTEYRNQCLLNF